MLKIDNYFKKLTRDQIEHRDLDYQQDVRARQEMRNQAQEVAISVKEIISISSDQEETTPVVVMNIYYLLVMLFELLLIK